MEDVSTVHPDRWKMSKGTKEDTAANVASIGHDVKETLPPLLAAADRSPGSVAALLPVARNLSALYEVLLRVSVIGESAAPKDQAAALMQAVTTLQAARRAFDDRVMAVATTEEQQASDLRRTATEARPVCPAIAQPVPGSGTKKKKKPAAS